MTEHCLNLANINFLLTESAAVTGKYQTGVLKISDLGSVQGSQFPLLLSSNMLVLLSRYILFLTLYINIFFWYVLLSFNDCQFNCFNTSLDLTSFGRP